MNQSQAKTVKRWLVSAISVGCICLLSSCGTLRDLASLKQLDFAIGGVENPRLAEVDLTGLQSAEDVSPADMLRLGTAVIRNELFFDLTVLVTAHNPEDNPVDARIVSLDWILLLDDTETVRGLTPGNIQVSPGGYADVPIEISLNLMEFFGESLGDLLNLGLAVSGASRASSRLKLQATPTIDTMLGPIRYPKPITILSHEVGG